MKKLFVLLLLTFDVMAAPYITLDSAYTTDSDHFDIKTVQGGFVGQNGYGAKFNSTSYHSKTFDAHTEAISGVYIEENNQYDVNASAGIKLIDSQTSTDIFVADVASHYYFKDMTVGAYVATDIVESERSIVNDVRYVYTAVDADVALSKQLDFNALFGIMHFTDDNNRALLRSTLTYTISPEYGIIVYGKVRADNNSNSGSRNYYSPDMLFDKIIGLKIKQRHGDLIYSAQADYGMRTVDIKNDGVYTDSIYSWKAQIETPPRKKDGVVFGITAQQSNVSPIYTGESDYMWTNVNGWMRIPF